MADERVRVYRALKAAVADDNEAAARDLAKRLADLDRQDYAQEEPGFLDTMMITAGESISDMGKMLGARAIDAMSGRSPISGAETQAAAEEVAAGRELTEGLREGRPVASLAGDVLAMAPAALAIPAGGTGLMGRAAAGALAGGVEEGLRSTATSTGELLQDVGFGAATGVAEPLMLSTVAKGVRSIPAMKSGDPGVDLLLGPEPTRAAIHDTTDEMLQSTVRGAYDRARTPFQQMYRDLQQQGSRIKNTNLLGAINRLSTDIEADPVVDNALRRFTRIRANDYNAKKAMRGVLQDIATSANRGANPMPNRARVAGQLAEAIQKDIDDVILDGSARKVSREYANQVVEPFGPVRSALSQTADPEDAWKAILRAKPSRLKSLAKSMTPDERDVIRRRALRDMLQRETQFTSWQSGSGAPVWRQLDKAGIGEFFTDAEWKGLQRVTGKLAGQRNPFRLATPPAAGAGVGVVAGGPMGAALGAAGGLALDAALETPAGRRFLVASAKMTDTQLEDTLRKIARDPQILQDLFGQIGEGEPALYEQTP